MKKLLHLAFTSTFLLLLSLGVPPVTAQEQGILSETVKIISYNLTNNNHVIEKSLASGTLISPDGLVLTNHHVATDTFDETYEAFSICVVTDEQEKPDCLYTASLIAKDKSLDIALLQINGRDIYGDPLPQFPWLDYHLETLPPVGEKLVLVGFPGIGGETITATEGTISGYDEREGFQQIKTDATISPGNSGGTAKDSSGTFVGVPSYLKSFFGTIGYIVPLTEINPWLEEHLHSPVQKDDFARVLLDTVLQKLYETDQQKKYTSSLFPFYEIEVPDPWKIAFINQTNLILKNTVKGYSLRLRISVDVGSYEATDALMQFLLKKIEKEQHQYTNYSREEADFHGLEGFLISYDEGNERAYYFLMPIENTLFSYSYVVSLENQEETEQAMNDVLATFTLVNQENNTAQGLRRYQQNQPDISISTFGDFYIAPIYGSEYEDEILYIDNPNSFEQEFEISEQHLPKEYWGLSKEEIFEKELKFIGQKLVNQYPDVVIDGLSGYAYTIAYRGDEFKQNRKKTVVVVLKDKKFFEFVYDDLVENYDSNIATVRKILKTFEYSGPENQESKGVYKIPLFKLLYEDIKHHVYEKAISALSSKELLQFPSRNFLPEEQMTRLAALEAVLSSKIFVEEGRNLTETEDGIATAESTQIFQDQEEESYYQLVNYALGKEILSRRDNFFPEKGINLAAALAMLCRTYELPVWDPSYIVEVPWYVPYIYKGLSLGVIPETVEKADAVLTRGEFASLLYDFVRIVGERSDL